MYDNGHTVCGVEISEQAVNEFFEENGIETVVSEKENVGKVHQVRSTYFLLLKQESLTYYIVTFKIIYYN